MVDLIADGKLSYRLNDLTQTLHKKVTNQKISTLKSTVAAGEHYIQDTETLILRTQMMKDYNCA